MIKYLVYIYCFLLIVVSCSDVKKETQQDIDSLSKNIRDTIIFDVKTTIPFSEKTVIDSLYKLKLIRIPWTGKDSFVENDEFVIFKRGKFKYIINGETKLISKYRLTENESHGLGEFLLNINSERFNSIDFYNDSIIIYQNAEDESSYIFVKIR